MTEKGLERQAEARDISRDFLESSSFRFNRLLDTMGNEPVLMIAVSGDDIDNNGDIPSALKGFLDDPSRPRNQKRIAVIRETEDDHRRHLENPWIANAFASGIKWEKI